MCLSSRDEAAAEAELPSDSSCNMNAHGGGISSGNAEEAVDVAVSATAAAGVGAAKPGLRGAELRHTNQTPTGVGLLSVHLSAAYIRAPPCMLTFHVVLMSAQG